MPTVRTGMPPSASIPIRAEEGSPYPPPLGWEGRRDIDPPEAPDNRTPEEIEEQSDKGADEEQS